MTGRVVVPLVTVAALAVSGAALSFANTSGPALHSPHPPSTTMPVTSAGLGCPSDPAGDTGSGVVAVAPGPVGNATSAGAAVTAIRTLDTPAAVLGSQRGTGSPVVASTSGPAGTGAQRGPLLVTAMAAAAPGLTAAHWSSYAGKSVAGLAAGWCLSAAEDWWFAGVDTSVGTSTSLVLLNPTTGTAVVDVSVFGPAGPVAVPGGRGIAVAPHSQQVINLAGFAPGRAALGLHVSATSGRIVAAVRTSALSALTPTGVDWVPATAAPSTSLLVGAAAPGSTSQRLVVANPGTRQAVVHLRFVSGTGTFVSTDVADLSVAPGAAVVTDVSAVVGSAAMGVRLSSTRPVLAASVDRSTRPVRDFSVSPASAALGAEAVVPVIPKSSLRLAFSSADRAPTVVTVAAVDGSGQVVEHARVTVGREATATWRSAQPRARYVVVSVPAGSHLHASAAFTSSSGTTTLPVLSGRWTEVHAGVVPAPVG